MGHRGLNHDRAPDEQLVVGRLTGLCGWAHLASCSRSPFSSTTNRRSAGCEWRRARRYLPFNSNTSRSIGSDEREKNPINDLFYVLRRQRLLQCHELIAHEVERQRSQARRKLFTRVSAAPNHCLGVAFMHFCKERRLATHCPCSLFQPATDYELRQTDPRELLKADQRPVRAL